ncbi:hypothetical protein P167DRAFT_248799 [Morchella conica CCBAS932]|uniref:Uncharacterized protein n=1 Tax=Morchella conica CCBAS932 TaxID=1392247 RepID=A0A3N4KXT2_9PEZI|nr:hypothetical protein P167DRAFT_248799 [Morchella conica CCBAS932]
MMSMLKTKNESPITSARFTMQPNPSLPFANPYEFVICFYAIFCFALFFLFFLYLHTMFSVCSRPCMMRPMAVSHFAHQYVGTNKIPSFDTSTSTVGSVTLSLPACITPNPTLRYCTVPTCTLQTYARLFRGGVGRRRHRKTRQGSRPDVKYRKKKEETKQLKPRSSSVE